MITDKNLSDRVFGFIDTIFSTNRASFGFPTTTKDAYTEYAINQSQRPNAITLLYYRIENNIQLGNGVASNNIIYDIDKKQIIVAQKQVEVVISILSKEKLAKNAMEFFNYGLQGERYNKASYGSSFDFDLILVDRSQPINLDELEQGAWVQRVDERLVFKYEDSLKMDEVEQLQKIKSFEDVKDIIQSEISIKGE
jgi:hypothetical protein